MPPYKLFRSRNWPELACAVPDDRSLPPFITDVSWEFDGTLTGGRDTSMKFNPSAAEVGIS